VPARVQVRGSMALHAPPDFNFWNTVTGHGWHDLPPFFSDRESRTLALVLRLRDDTLASCHVQEREGTVFARFSADRPVGSAGRREIRSLLRSCLRMDEDFSPFHAAARREARFRWIAHQRAGRLLRAPSVFEDVVKMICTTNCTWTLTRQMVTRLVEEFGPRLDEARSAFPSPEALAGTSERALRRRCSTGYRAPYILRLADEVASGRRDLEALRTRQVSSAALFQEVREIRGIGPYAAGNLLKLLGRYDYLGLDSWVRARFAEIHHRGRPVKDSTIERAFARQGNWRGLFFWLEMTRHWHNDKFAV
jgi:3-methyladenine DNA glycosylase/8-oxoguanine DNA glycosylase